MHSFMEVLYWVGAVVFGGLQAYGLFAQARKIRVMKSADSVAVETFAWYIVVFSTNIFYGQAQDFKPMIATAVVCLLASAAIVYEANKHMKPDPERSAFLVLCALCACLAGFGVQLGFPQLTYKIVSGLTILALFKMLVVLEGTSRTGAADIKQILITICASAFWSGYGFLKGDSVMGTICFLYAGISVFTAATWHISYLKENNQPFLIDPRRHRN